MVLAFGQGRRHGGTRPPPYWNLVPHHPPNEKGTVVEKLARVSMLAVNLVVIVNYCNGTVVVPNFVQCQWTLHSSDHPSSTV